ncbi:MAG: threonine synthase [Desulfovibrionaceae bacterium]|nr:threonine synthase [Desulfovibrionaceae bacterium]
MPLFQAAASFSPSGDSFVSGARCVICGRRFDPAYLNNACVCPDHGDEGILDIEYDYEAASARFPASEQPGLWRYRALLPLPWTAPLPPPLTGLTPLYDAPALARAVNCARVLIKDDTRQPTGSFKDRASCLAVALARVQGAPVVATASTGNAAAALAGMAAAMHQTCVIFVPVSAPAAKVAQPLAYGAHVILVRGTYDQAFALCMEACRRKGWYNRNTAYNPCMAEGKKSAAFEIAEDMGWQTPDAVFVGTGDGCILAGLHKGFSDLLRLGRTARIPRLYGVQAEGSDFLCQAWEEGRRTAHAVLAKAPIAARTAADSICAGLPRDRIKAMRAVCESRGRFVRVSDTEILSAVPALARACGVFAEPAGAAPLAGLARAARQGLIAPGDTVCLVVTGSGLKDPGAVTAALSLPETVEGPVSVDPDPAALDDALFRLGLETKHSPFSSL